MKRQPTENADTSLAEGRIGVLLVNLGTPEAATAPAVRKYLAEFLSDRRIVDYPRFLWLPLLYGVILNTRPAKTARAYAKVWREESGESPLRYFTRRQAERLNGEFGGGLLIDWAMRYGTPSVADKLSAMKAAGAARILVIPLYPQYSSTTTASVNDAVFAAVEEMRAQPTLRFAPPFATEPAYIDALASSARTALQPLREPPECVILSFHGLPERLTTQGDPYASDCHATANGLRAAMGWSERFAPIAFQSRFGPEKWLEPSTEDLLTSLAREGAKRVAVITPGFVADCIETLEEIAIAGKQEFLTAGGEQFTAIPCLNDSDEMIALLETIVRRELKGWLD